MKYMKGQTFVSFLLAMLVTLIMLRAFYPILQESILNVTQNPSIDNMSKTFLELVIPIIALCVLLSPISYLVIRRDQPQM